MAFVPAVARTQHYARGKMPISNPSSGFSGLTGDVTATAAGVSTLAANALVKVVDTAVSGAAVTSIDITGLDLGAAKKYLLYYHMINTTATENIISMFANGDTTATNYYREGFVASSVGVSGQGANDASVFDVYNVAESAGSMTISQPSGTRPRSVLTENQKAYAVPNRLLMSGWIWTSTNNVTRLTFTGNQANTIAIGSRIIIFKVV